MQLQIASSLVVIISLHAATSLRLRSGIIARSLSMPLVNRLADAVILEFLNQNMDG